MAKEPCLWVVTETTRSVTRRCFLVEATSRSEACIKQKEGKEITKMWSGPGKMEVSWSAKKEKTNG